jgi:hypothetical protein
VIAVTTVMMAGIAAPAVAVMPSPAWDLHVSSAPTNLPPGPGGHIVLLLGNRCGLATDGSEVTVTDTLPAGVTPTEANGAMLAPPKSPVTCSIAGQTVTCTLNEAEIPGLDSSTLTVEISVTSALGVSGGVSTATVIGGGAPSIDSALPLTVSDADAPFAISSFDFTATDASGATDLQAADHPALLSVGFDLNTRLIPNTGLPPSQSASQTLKDVVVDLPLGLVGNPQVLATCTEEEFRIGEGFCPSTTMQLGAVNTFGPNGLPGWDISGDGTLGPLDNIAPPRGFPAAFAFSLGNVPIASFASVVHTAAGYVLRTSASGISRAFGTPAVRLNIFGHPGTTDPVSLSSAPFLTNRSDCSSRGDTATIHVDSWKNPASLPLNSDGSPNFSAANFAEPQWQTKTVALPPVAGCEKLQFNPTVAVRPDSAQAGAPTGLVTDLKVPQSTDPVGLATPPLRDAIITLPQGMTISPSSADGLQSCSDAEIALSSTEPATCPEASAIGTVTVHTPLLAEPLEGSVFLGAPLCSPCTDADAQAGRMVRLFVELKNANRGVDLKLAGTTSVDPSTGRLTARFLDNPQLPFDDLKLELKSGPRAPLANPGACGSYESTAELRPWSSPFTPTAVLSSSFPISDCGSPSQFAPTVASGTVDNQAGGFSQFTTTFGRQDADQHLSRAQLTTPPGLIGILSHVALCKEPDAGRGSCYGDSRVGEVTATVGPGSTPLHVPISGQGPDPVYLTEGYKGAPFGLTFVIPAIAGPFNLGTVVVRAAVDVDPTTGQLTVTSDPLPQILDGIPLDTRSVSIDVNREDFIFNPTNCTPTIIKGTLSSTSGASANFENRFQATNCADLRFHPHFSASTQGNGTFNRNGASLKVKIATSQGPHSNVADPAEANIKKVDVALPTQLPSRLSTLQKACTEKQFADNPAGCPEASNVGSAIAHTPVLPVPLVGPAYLVSHGGAAFPDLDIILQGYGVTIVLTGNTDIKKGVTFSRFDTAPDAPISSFELTLPESKFSALAANGNLCKPTELAKVRKWVAVRRHGRTVRVLKTLKKQTAAALTMPTTITAQNGAVVRQTTRIAVTGCPKAKKPGKTRARRGKHKKR